MKYVILSDIHANVTALNSVMASIDEKFGPEAVGFIILGDFINYGPRSNEVIGILKKRKLHSVILGNHEHAYMSNDYTRFSSQRGVDSLKYTVSTLNSDSKQFINENNKAVLEIEIESKKILLVHGSLTDIYWGKMNDVEMQKEAYSKYDYVLSGHTHVPHLKEIFFPSNDPNYRNKKKVTFLNPGSVGQPRNHNSLAQFCVVDFSTEWVCFEKTVYDIETEMSHFNVQIDPFYKNRLKNGI